MRIVAKYVFGVALGFGSHILMVDVGGAPEWVWIGVVMFVGLAIGLVI